MEADECFAESLIRDRLAEARTRAESAALYCQSHGGSADAKGIGRSKSPAGATGLPAPGSAR